MFLLAVLNILGLLLVTWATFAVTARGLEEVAETNVAAVVSSWVAFLSIPVTFGCLVAQVRASTRSARVVWAARAFIAWVVGLGAVAVYEAASF